MLARNETILKWLRYILAAALCFLIQGAALQRITLWGVIPFVYPLVAVRGIVPQKHIYKEKGNIVPRR